MVSIKRAVLAGAMLVGGAVVASPGPAGAAIPPYCFVTAGNLVQNCGFESGDLTGWTTTAPANSLVNGVHPHTGSYAFLATSGGSGPSSVDLSQSLPALSPGATYSVSFWAFDNQPDPSTTFSASVTNVRTPGRGTTQTLFTEGPSTPLGNNWPADPITASFRARERGSSASTLHFAFYRTNQGAYFLDDIAVTQALTLTASPSSTSRHGVSLTASFGANTVTADANGNHGAVTFLDDGRPIRSCAHVPYAVNTTCNTVVSARQHLFTAVYTPAGATNPSIFSNAVENQARR